MTTHEGQTAGYACNGQRLDRHHFLVVWALLRQGGATSSGWQAPCGASARFGSPQ